jgi:hypothetical protein
VLLMPMLIGITSLGCSIISSISSDYFFIYISFFPLFDLENYVFSLLGGVGWVMITLREEEDEWKDFSLFKLWSVYNLLLYYVVYGEMLLWIPLEIPFLICGMIGYCLFYKVLIF